MIGWAWWNPILALLAVGVGGYFAVRGAVARGTERVACWTHGLMAIAMAGMFWPAADPVPAPVGAVVFAVLAAWFAAARLRQGAGAAGEPLHLAVGCAAMVVMYLGLHGGGHGGGAAGHAGHHGAAAGSAGLLTVAVGLVLTAYFAWHAWAAGSASSVPAGQVRTAVRDRVRIEAAAHVTLDVLMAVMFVGAL